MENLNQTLEAVLSGIKNSESPVHTFAEFLTIYSIYLSHRFENRDVTVLNPQDVQEISQIWRTLCVEQRRPQGMVRSTRAVS